MKLRVGYELVYDCPQPTPMMLMLNVHYSRAGDAVVPDRLVADPDVPMRTYRDSFGNWCSRIVAPAGRIRLSTDAIVEASDEPEYLPRQAEQHEVQDLPDECLQFLLGSRYCETDRLSDLAWSLFGGTPPGAARVQAICDYVHRRIAFDYQDARSTRTAFEAHQEQRGVCRDFAHLAVAFCRCMNIPARYCTGYLSDIGIPPPYGPMDFAAWLEAYVGGEWHVFDPRNNMPRIGRVLMARGRDAADVAISNTFGPNTLSSFTVVAEQVNEQVADPVAAAGRWAGAGGHRG
jgi:transglutaminase-like putative cysteine protease